MASLSWRRILRVSLSLCSVVAIIVLVIAGLSRTVVGQSRAPFATPPPGSPPAKIRPYSEFGGCPEEPAQFHRCAQEKAKTFNPPRTADGKPDFQGYWNRIGIRNLENIEEHPESIDGSGDRSSVVDPADGRIPYQPWAAAKREAHFEKYLDAAQFCLPDGAPRFGYGATKFVVQTPGHVFMLNDYADTYRIIPTDGRPHLGPDIKLWQGDLRGRWEGNTLVIDVTNQLAEITMDHIGNFFSQNAHVVERITMIDKDVIYYTATIEDAKVFTRPWTMAWGWRRNPNPKYEMWEQGCWEGVQSALKYTDEGRKRSRGAFEK
jgi:hypothetical protein